MSTLSIIKYGDPILRRKALKVDRIEKEDLLLIENMTETMYAHEGIGLAAPQVGTSKRIIVLDIGEGLRKLINPVVLESEGENEHKEGCLSIPEVYVEVKRPSYTVVEGLNEYGERVRIEAEGLLSRVLHHEIDHLNGLLIVDYLSPAERVTLKRRLRNLRRYK
ncbi:MAG TPA: peptide deformylase [Candidatus Omnitrophica bacterium]|nr:peptide deformylase [Candidatus Omnitrophota bacterium]